MAQKAEVPAKRSDTFALTTGMEEKFVLPPELRDAVEDSDYDGYEEEGQALPIVSIRQRELKNEKGTIVRPSGGFKIYDPVQNGNSDRIPDMTGKTGLSLSFLADVNSRVLFEKLTDTKPSCMSTDGLSGIGKPGGVCETCEHSQLIDGRRGKCAAQKNVLCRDLVNGAIYVLRLGPSGLTPYRHFKHLLKRMKVAPATIMVKVTTEFKSEPEAHYIPVFESQGPIEVAVFLEIKKIREELRPSFNKTIDIQEEEETVNTVETEFETVDPKDVPTGEEPPF